MSLKTVDELDCKNCGHIWEPSCVQDEQMRPLCRHRIGTRVSPKAILGDVPIYRVKMEQERLAKEAAKKASKA